MLDAITNRFSVKRTYQEKNVGLDRASDHPAGGAGAQEIAQDAVVGGQIGANCGEKRSEEDEGSKPDSARAVGAICYPPRRQGRPYKLSQ